ncbi:MAG: site-specific DNA-methyltransferase [Eubacterium sp.]|nr:site-specific DNA-methyltransferase [Eubacterium sp.]
MSVISRFPEIIERAALLADEAYITKPPLADKHGNILFEGDCLELLKALASDPEAEKVQTIYIDPPFFSESDYDAIIEKDGEKQKKHAYRDRWKDGMAEYLIELTARLILMKNVMRSDGLIFLHLDWHAVHYVKVIMDEVFGEKNFVNEIVWQYKSGGSSKKHLARKHDTILVYSKTGKYKFIPLKEKSYNRGLKPYRFKGVEEFRDDIGWYTLVNMKDVWQIDMVGRTSGERTGYATQKPEKLIERILECSSEEGDLVADFYCGSGTLPAVCARTGRRFIASDKGALAIRTTKKRLSEFYGDPEIEEQMTFEFGSDA